MPRIIKIGRTHGNDVVFNNPTVSHQHAEMTIADDNRSALIRDLGSINGTFVNGKRISQQVTISLSDQLRFGTVDTNLAEIVAKLRETKINEPTSNCMVIGRGGDCHIRMNYDDVSTRHAVLKKRADSSLVIEDLKSANGTFVNGQRVVSQVLKKGDQVTIAGKYPLEWEQYFPVVGGTKVNDPGGGTVGSGGGGTSPLWKRFLPYAAALLALAVLGVGAYFLFSRSKTDIVITSNDDKPQPLTKEQIYERYHDAVCLVGAEYGYKIFIEDKDYTKYLTGDEYCEKSSYSGTAFFITSDGKLATNLHIARPWLYDEEKEQIRRAVDEYLSENSIFDSRLNRAKLEIKPEILNMFVILDGLPLSMGNQIEVEEYSASDDINKDVAILQTKSRSLPDRVKNIIDIKQANSADSCYKVGKQVYTIGFPYAVDIALNSNQEIKNQIHDGSISQDRGKFEFGHDAETASGASGSPILDEYGKLIGIHHAGVRRTQGFNMGIKVSYLLDLLK